MEEPVERISATAALCHAFFREHSLKPSTSDMALFPSTVLKLVSILDPSRVTSSDDGSDQTTEP